MRNSLRLALLSFWRTSIAVPVRISSSRTNNYGRLSCAGFCYISYLTSDYLLRLPRIVLIFFFCITHVSDSGFFPLHYPCVRLWLDKVGTCVNLLPTYVGR
ncbi:hypothetical protein F4803DRAFT_542382 [Xylaria telfairii]|nr:hypothetical protein F4803DRAFT_542382 [Xylaria telfairii]